MKQGKTQKSCSPRNALRKGARWLPRPCAQCDFCHRAFIVFWYFGLQVWGCICRAHSVLSLPPCVRVRVRVWQRNICAYAVVIVVKMAEGETEKEYDTRNAIGELRERFQGLTTTLKESSLSPLEASLRFCQEFCQVCPFFCCSSWGSLQPLWLPGRGCASTFATTM